MASGTGFVFIAILFTISTYYEVSGNKLRNLLRLSQKMEDEGLLPGGESSEQAALESVLDKKPVVIVLGDQLLKQLQPHQHAKSANRDDDLLAKLLGHQNLQKSLHNEALLAKTTRKRKTKQHKESLPNEAFLAKTTRKRKTKQQKKKTHKTTQKPKKKQQKKKQKSIGSVNDLPGISKIQQLIDPAADSSERAILEAVLSPKTAIIIIEEGAMKKIQQYNKKKMAATVRLHYHKGVQKSKSQKTPLYTNKDRNVIYSPALQNLLRISNDVECRAQQRCEMICNDKYVGKKKIECEDVCEEKYECPDDPDDFTQEDSPIESEEDPCELGDDCGNESCGANCPISTKGYTLEPDSRNKCPRC